MVNYLSTLLPVVKLASEATFSPGHGRVHWEDVVSGCTYCSPYVWFLLVPIPVPHSLPAFPAGSQMPPPQMLQSKQNELIGVLDVLLTELMAARVRSS